MKYFLLILCCIFICLSPLLAQQGLIDAFPLKYNDLSLSRLAKPGVPFNKVGHKFAILGEESGSLEAWVYPLKIFRDFKFSFHLGTSTQPIPARNVLRRITVTPEATAISYCYQSFTVKAIYVTPVDEPFAVIFLSVNTVKPLTIVCSFLPVLQPMWPAGIGGQYAFWSKDLKAYVMSEPTRKNHAILGSPVGEVVSLTPAHMLSDVPNEFKITVSDPEKWKNKFIPIYMTGGYGSRDTVMARYKKMQENPAEYYHQNVRHYTNLRNQTIRIQTPDENLNLALEWAKVAYDNLIVDNPDLGKGLVAGLAASGTSGRPGFGWFFGGDAYMNTLSLNSLGMHESVKEILKFFQKWQRQDGKMAHELTQAARYLDWWNDYPYGYIHADTTPFYIVSMHDYYTTTADTHFVRESWHSLRKAYEWCLQTDANDDGLMDNKQAGLGASEYGALTDIETDIYLAAVWIKATEVMPDLAMVAGEKDFAKRVRPQFQRAVRAFQDKFWYNEGGFYSYAFNADGKKVKEISPWLCVSLMWDYGTARETLSSLQKINSADLTTDWGVRLLSHKSPFFDPLGYNYGAVWPFVTGWVIMAQYRHQMGIQGYYTLQSILHHTFNDQLGTMPEVLSGLYNIPLEESVGHQGFSSGGVVLPSIRGLLGLRGDAVNKIIEFSPQFPASWTRVEIENFKVGKAVFSFSFARDMNHLNCIVKSENARDYRVQFSPSLGIGTEISASRLDGQDISHQIFPHQQQVQVMMTYPVAKEKHQLEVMMENPVEVLPPAINTQIGEKNQGLRIISIVKDHNKLLVNLQGLSGRSYRLNLHQSGRLQEVQGGNFTENYIQFQMPASDSSEYIDYQLILVQKE